MFRGLVSIVFLIQVAMAAPNEFDVSASLSRSKITQTQIVQLTLRIDGTSDDIYKNIQLPQMLTETFQILSTSQSSSFSYVNGKVNRNRQYQYNLRPIKSGIFIIDPIKVRYKGKGFATKPLRIVIKGSPNLKGSKNVALNTQKRIPPIKTQAVKRYKNIFLETAVSTQNIYLGESIDYAVRLYRRIQLWSQISIQQDDIQNGWQTNIKTSKERVVRKGGQRYYELELSKKKIRPLSPGNFIIPQLSARFVVDPFSGEYTLVSELVSINVMPLPEPLPPQFTGAIGQYTMDVMIPKKSIKSNTFQLQVILSGAGNFEVIKPPIIKSTDRFRVLSAPKNGDSIMGQQTFDYVVIPKKSGEIYIPAIEFSYFSKETRDYVLLASEPIIFEASVDQVAQSNSEIDVKKDIQFLVQDSLLNKVLAILNNRKVMQGLVGINVLLLVWILGSIVKKRMKFSKNGTRKNKKQAFQSVQTLCEKETIETLENVLVEVLHAYTGYKKKNIEPKAIESQLMHAEVSDALVKSTMQWIKNAQVLQYSKEKTSTSTHSVTDSLKRILTSIMAEGRLK
jgi:hypothetical protein